MHNKLIAVSAGLALFFSAASEATLLITLEQLSNTEISLSASGEFEPSTPREGPSGVFLVNPFVTYVEGFTASLTNNTVTTDRPSMLQEAAIFKLDRVAGVPNGLFTFFDLGHVAGDIINGSVNITFSNETLLAPVGSTGSVWYGMDDGKNLVTPTGTWEIVGASVPLPSGSLLFGLGGLLLVGLRRQFA